MPKNILIIDGHPDSSDARLCHALAAAYAAGAQEIGHSVKRLSVAELDFPLLRNRDEWEKQAPVPVIAAAQRDLAWADHLVIIYPLWLGGMPARLKGFFEQVFRPDFAFGRAGASSRKSLKGKSARVVVTMGMPGFVYRWYFGAHSLKSLKRNILAFVGISPVRACVFGLIESGPPRKRERWLRAMAALGRRAG